jgi:hypothetical protein
MRGYPKHINTKSDYEVLLAIPKFRERALADLKKLRDGDSDTMRVATTLQKPDAEEKDQKWNMEERPNPNPGWKQKGFKSRKELDNLTSAG